MTASTPPAAKHAAQLGERPGVVGDVFENLRRDHRVEAVIGERQGGGVAAQHSDDVLVLGLASLGHRRQRRSSGDHLVGGAVDRYRAISATGELEGVPAEPGAGVEDQRAGRHAELREPIEPNREHDQRRPMLTRDLATFSGIAKTSRYCSTVSSAQRRHVHRSTTRRRPASPTRARSSASSSPRRIVSARASASPAATLQAPSRRRRR